MKIRLLASTLMACVVLLFSALSLSACTGGPVPDLGERDAAVSSVMRALNVHDKNQLVKLAQPGPQTADSYAQLLLSQWGGVKDSGYSTVYSSEFSPDIVAVRVSTTDPSGSPAEVQFSLRWNDKAWLLNIGPD
ncbi:hypothetical protein [Arthrobacter sp. NicSoilB8]|uniref:hypothetical protein n=1 Tax=Arthrobacter sp. NicSoilB8 TaxID=2830998 RepID=UPI001CC37776|nr:hypothetical protein [Arthrobacter sp. NicSoilB8]BCW71865.1 hypothetical protein NicSoilB8_29090 [Arthrobacter sp. NicSoilB8]